MVLSTFILNILHSSPLQVLSLSIFLRLLLFQIAEIGCWTQIHSKGSTEDEKENSELPPSADPETNVYDFGIMLLEIISGKMAYSEREGSLVNWVSNYICNRQC